MKPFLLLPICALALGATPLFAQDPPRPEPERRDPPREGQRAENGDGERGENRDGNADRPREPRPRQMGEPRRERVEIRRRVEVDRPGPERPFDGPRPRPEQGNRPPNEIREQLEHLQQAVGQLRAGNMNELAERLENVAARMRERLERQQNPSPERGGPGGPGGPWSSGSWWSWWSGVGGNSTESARDACRDG